MRTSTKSVYSSKKQKYSTGLNVNISSSLKLYVCMEQCAMVLEYPFRATLLPSEAQKFEKLLAAWTDFYNIFTWMRQSTNFHFQRRSPSKRRLDLHVCTTLGSIAEISSLPMNTRFFFIIRIQFIRISRPRFGKEYIFCVVQICKYNTTLCF